LISPLSSATGMKVLGPMHAPSGRSQRSRHSTALIVRVLESTSGW